MSFCREKRIKYVVQLFRANSWSGVFHFNCYSFRERQPSETANPNERLNARRTGDIKHNASAHWHVKAGVLRPQARNVMPREDGRGAS
jgi:hypothetical protein